MNGQVNLPFIPETVTVHLGAPDQTAQNVTVSFVDYIKNVASSEIYPTWPESALRANILAQISFALNRIYTEYYRSRGYNFDITNSTAIDQSFTYGRDIFENVSNIVDDIFDTYIRRDGAIEPLFALYCDGRNTFCPGLRQWETVSLANQGLGPFDILTRFYGQNIGLVSDAPIQGAAESFPGRTLSVGSSGNDVKLIQTRLNRISRNYPAIPKIVLIDGIFATDTEDAVRTFQEIFSLPQTGTVDRSTWYAIARIYSGVKSLSDLNSEGIAPEEVTDLFAQELSLGYRGRGASDLQYFLRFIAEFNPAVEAPVIDGIFGEATQSAVRSFQREYGLPDTGVVDLATWEAIFSAYQGMLDSLPQGYFSDSTEPYPGFPVRLGSRGEEVRRVQQYLNVISEAYPQIPKLSEDGVFGAGTQAAVLAFQSLFGLEPDGTVALNTYNRIAALYRDLVEGNKVNEGQFPGELG
ncbi:MAG: spore cortex-lytic protein [Ruminococcaceae bacterium]|nr:spore cortex-lytic protein [Oscillospiraceae bacterium]